MLLEGCLPVYERMARKSPVSFGTLNTFGTDLAVNQSKIANLMIMTVLVMTTIVNHDDGDDDYYDDDGDGDDDDDDHLAGGNPR